MADSVTCNFCRLDLARLRPEEVGLQKLQELNEKYGAELAPDVRSFHKLVVRIRCQWRAQSGVNRRNYMATFSVSAWDAMPFAERAKHHPERCAFV